MNEKVGSCWMRIDQGRLLSTALLGWLACSCGGKPPADDRHPGSSYEAHGLRIKPVAVQRLTVGHEASIEIEAVDLLGHAVTFELRQLPPDVAQRIDLRQDPQQGRATLRWRPAAGDVGRHQPKLIARDGQGELAVLSFRIDVEQQPRMAKLAEGTRW